MKGRRIVAFLLVAGITISLFSGCGSERKTEKGTQNSSGITATTAADGGQMIGNMYKTGLPIVKNPVTFKMVARRRVTNGPYEEMVFFKNLEQKTNVKIEWDAIPEAQYGEKKNLLLASNDLPDAFFGRFSLNNNDLIIYGSQGVLIKLDELFDKYAPRLKAAFAARPDIKAFVTAPDNHLYAAPFVFETGAGHVPDNLFVYKPWLDKLGLKIPDTIDEFYNMLKMFKEKDPNGNGKADEIPMTFIFDHNQHGIGSLFGAFGRADTLGGKDTVIPLHLVVENGKVVMTATQPEYKKAIGYFNKYFKEGLIDKEGFTQDPKQMGAKGKTPDVTVGCFMGWNDFDLGADRAKDYVIIPPIAGPDGKRTWGWRPIDNTNPTGLSITNKCKNPEILVRWVDEFYDKRTTVEANFGPVGVNLVDKGNNTFEFMPTPQGMTYDEFRFKNAPAGDAPITLFAEDNDKVIPRTVATKKKWNDIEKYYKPYATTVYFPGIMLSTSDTERVKVLHSDIMKLIEEKRAKWLMEGGIDTEWEAYLAKLKQMGIDEFVQIHQKNYDRLYKK